MFGTQPCIERRLVFQTQRFVLGRRGLGAEDFPVEQEEVMLEVDVRA